jgi:polysaccharide export outer membrane protein
MKKDNGKTLVYYKMKRKSISILILPLLPASCVTSRRVNLMQAPGQRGIPTYADTLTYEDYQVRVGDRLYVYVYSIDERVSKMFNPSGTGINSSQIRQSSSVGGSYDLYTYLVLEDGTIDYPMVGRVAVRGMTTREIKNALEQELSTYVSGYGDYQIVGHTQLVHGSGGLIDDKIADLDSSEAFVITDEGEIKQYNKLL